MPAGYQALGDTTDAQRIAKIHPPSKPTSNGGFPKH